MSPSPYQLPQYPGQKQPPQFNPNAAPGGNGIYYGQQIGAQDPSLSYQPDLTSNDPNRIFRNSQNVSYNLGAGIDSDLYQQGQQYGNMASGYGNAMNRSYQQLQQNPGYSPEQQQQIIREQQYQGLQATPEQYAALGPNAGESAGMTGDPSSYGKAYNPNAINTGTQEMADHLRQNVGKTEGVNSNILGQQQQSLSKAIDPKQLNASGAYQDANSAILNTTGDRLDSASANATNRLDSATNNPALGISGEYGRQAGMTDAEVQQMADAGARDVGLRYQAAEGDAERRAAAGGNTSALAVGAQKARLGQQSATESADARVNAQLAARQAQRGAATGVEQTRLGAEQYQTGQKVNAGQYLGSQGSQNAQYEGQLAGNINQQQENTRLGAATNLAGMNIGAANQVAQNQLQANQYTGNQGAATEQAIGAQGQQGQQFSQNLGTNIAMAQDQTAAQRAAQQYGIRQGNQQYQIGNTFNQGTGVNDRLSQSNTNVANAGRADQQENRQWLTGQTGTYLGAQQNSQQQRIGNYGTLTGAMNNNANAWGNYQLQKSAQPGVFDKVVGAATGAAKAYLGGG